MTAFKPKVKGIDETIAKLRRLSKDADDLLDSVMEATAKDMVDFARTECNKVIGKTSYVPKGKLVQSIQDTRVADKNYIVSAGGGIAPYAPYVEFGTGGLVEVPKEFDEQARLAIGKGIRKVNLPARPFMYPTYIYGKKHIETLLKQEIKDLVKKNK